MKQKYIFILIAVLLTVIVAVLAIKAKQDNKLASRLSHAAEFSGATRSKLEEIGKLNNEALTLSEKSKTASQVQKTQNIAQLETNLESRAAKIQALVGENPDAALAVMLPPKAIADITQQAPTEAGKFLEKSITVSNATLEVIHIDNFDENDRTKSTGEIRYYIIKNISKQRLYLAGGELELSSGTVVNINGYQLPSGSILAASDTSSFQVVSVPTLQSVGEQKTLTILVNFTDSGPVPFTKEQAKELVFNGPMQKYYNENSHGKAWFSGNVVGWYTLPRNGYINGYCQWPDLGLFDNLGDDLVSLFNRDGINLSNYGRVLIIASHPCMGGGFSTVGKYNYTIGTTNYYISESWVGAGDSYNQTSYMPGLPSEWRSIDFVLAHELGHALGVVHANSWSCSVGVLYGSDCHHNEYGNYYDTMGAGIYSLNFNAYFKDTLGWLNKKSNIISVGNTGGNYLTYTLSPLNSLGGYRAINITPQGMTKPSYYVEYRTATGYDSYLKNPYINLLDNTNGVFINWIPDREQYAPMSRLLDMTPGSWSWDNVVLAKGKEFTDLGRGVSIKLGAKTITNNTASVMVKTFKPACQNVAPAFGSIGFSNYAVFPGDIVVGSALIYNADSPSCRASLFEVTALSPNGWSTYVYPEGKFSLDAGELRYEGFVINVPLETLDGSYTVFIRVTKYKSDGVTVDKVAEYPVYLYVGLIPPRP